MDLTDLGNAEWLMLAYGSDFLYHTELLQANVHPEIVSASLGHSKISVTMDTYSHLTDSIEGITADTLDNLLE
jgi:hypothetical protein